MKSALGVLLNSKVNIAKDEILKNFNSYDLQSLIIPAGYKEFWEECAEILFELPLVVIDAMAAELMVWFQDLNWPGINLIEKKLRQLQEGRLNQIVQQAFMEACLNEDEEWKFNLSEVFGISSKDNPLI